MSILYRIVQVKEHWITNIYLPYIKITKCQSKLVTAHYLEETLRQCFHSLIDMSWAWRELFNGILNKSWDSLYLLQLVAYCTAFQNRQCQFDASNVYFMTATLYKTVPISYVARNAAKLFYDTVVYSIHQITDRLWKKLFPQSRRSHVLPEETDCVFP